MNRDINLLSSAQTSAIRKKTTVPILRKVAIGLLLLVGFFSIAIFLVRFQSPLTSLQKEQNSYLSALDAQNTKIAKYLLVQDRLKHILAFTSKRSQFDKILTDIVNITTENIRINSLNIDKKNISLTATSPSLASINVFLDGIRELGSNKEVFQRVVLNGITFDQRTNAYFVSFEGDLVYE